MSSTRRERFISPATNNDSPAEESELDGSEIDSGAAGEAGADAATLKARHWDDWKDDHQKGAGNRMK
jgi:hypothetical protein